MGLAIASIDVDTGHSSVAGGFQAGFNWQFAPTWVAGIEADCTWTHAKGSFNGTMTVLAAPPVPLPNSSIALSTQVDWLASVRARLGFLLTPNLLAYGTGGVAWGKVDDAANNDITTSGYHTSAALSSTPNGYVLGGGLEWAVTNNWLLRGEYLFYHLNSSQNVIASAVGFPSFPSTYSWDSTSINQARAAISYKF